VKFLKHLGVVYARDNMLGFRGSWEFFCCISILFSTPGPCKVGIPSIDHLACRVLSAGRVFLRSQSHSLRKTSCLLPYRTWGALKVYWFDSPASLFQFLEPAPRCEQVCTLRLLFKLVSGHEKAGTRARFEPRSKGQQIKAPASLTTEPTSNLKCGNMQNHDNSVDWLKSEYFNNFSWK